jgi:hypothetical protein
LTSASTPTCETTSGEVCPLTTWPKGKLVKLELRAQQMFDLTERGHGGRQDTMRGQHREPGIIEAGKQHHDAVVGPANSDG